MIFDVRPRSAKSPSLTAGVFCFCIIVLAKPPDLVYLVVVSQIMVVR